MRGSEGVKVNKRARHDERKKKSVHQTRERMNTNKIQQFSLRGRDRVDAVREGDV